MNQLVAWRSTQTLWAAFTVDFDPIDVSTFATQQTTWSRSNAALVSNHKQTSISCLYPVLQRKSKTQGPTMPPYASPAVSAFATNLRLLDLDKSPDWPGFTAHVFSTKEAQQNQKNRIRCIEWALYRLFEIWDAEETKNVDARS